MNFHETYCIPSISVEDAWRVEDPISMARPCNHEVLGEIQKP